MLLLNTSPKELGLELVRVLFVGLVIGILGGLAANLFVLGVDAIDGLIREQMVGRSAQSAGLIRWAALIAGAFGIYGLKQAFKMDRWHGPADAILGAHRPDAPFPAREGFISTTAAFVSASAGASVGQYGPVLHFVRQSALRSGPYSPRGFRQISTWHAAWRRRFRQGSAHRLLPSC